MTTTFYSGPELETITTQLLGKVLDVDNVVVVLGRIKQKYLSEHDFRIQASLDPVRGNLSSNLLSLCNEVETPLGRKLFYVRKNIKVCGDAVKFSETIELNLQSLLFAREFGPYVAVDDRKNKANSLLMKTLAKRARLPKNSYCLSELVNGLNGYCYLSE
ncbi:hypothetical protein HY494_01760 [Candidatus Woesearchaeota archaeon]|nr:hypothetical protein [Candidatus Woesearchaeota archaeon]